MTNAAYQLLIQELEQILPPRVVSRSLKEGLTSLGRTPEDVTMQDLEELLRGPLLRQLQALLPVGRADEAVNGILERILDPETESLLKTPAFEQQVRTELDELTAQLRPFNLYFEWPEVQKLRAQLQLVKEELDGGGNVTGLLSEARDQLALLRQKLEDQLVLQAGELSELNEALERLKSLGGPRVRRLESLINQIRGAQQQRTLVPAEIDQARLLSVDLRKLLESSVYATSEPLEEIDVQATIELLPDEVNERLLKLDLANETHRLEQLELQYLNLLALRSDLTDRLAALRDRIGSGESATTEITALELALQQAFSQERTALTRELAQIAADEAALDTPVGSVQLRQALQVANGILATTLPDPADVSHIRSLHELAREQLEVMTRTIHDGVEMADARKLAALELDSRQNTLNELFQLEQELSRLPEHATAEFAELQQEVRVAKQQLEAGRDEPDLNPLWLRLDDVRNSLASRLDTIAVRTDAALATFSRVERLNSEDVLRVRRILQHLADNAERLPQLSLNLTVQLEASLREAEELLGKLEQEFEATRNIADQLVSANILDDLLGGSGALKPDERAPETAEPAVTEQATTLASGSEPLDALLTELAAERGVDQLLLTKGDQPLGGTYSASTAGLMEAVSNLETDLNELGGAIQAGPLDLLTIELSRSILAVAWPAPGHRLLVLVSVPATLSLVLHRLRQQLSSLHGLLDDDPALA